MFEVYFFVTIFSAATKIQMDVMPSLWEVIHREEKSMDWTHTNDNINKDFFCRKITWKCYDKNITWETMIYFLIYLMKCLEKFKA